MIIEIKNKETRDILVKISLSLEATQENINDVLAGYSFSTDSIATIIDGKDTTTIEIPGKSQVCVLKKEVVLKSMFDGCTSDEQLARIVTLFNEYPVLGVAMDICDHTLFFDQVAVAVSDGVITQGDADMLAGKCPVDDNMSISLKA